MSISYVLRLRSDALADGRFIGEIEAVSDAQRRVIRTVDQMAAFILETGGRQAAEREIRANRETGGHQAADREINRV